MTEEYVDEQELLEENDWDITPDGLYIATRGFLARRGYCCANKCRNCPYLNWRDNPAWRPLPHRYVRRTSVSAKARSGALAMLQFHQEQLAAHKDEKSEEKEWHRTMIKHYEFLLERWT